MDKGKKKIIIKGLLAIALVAIAVVCSVVFVLSTVRSSADSSANRSEVAEGMINTAVNPIKAQVDFQNNIDEMLLAELASGYYTPEEPLVVVNPYKISPLTALILFQTTEPAQISIDIPGVIEQTEINFSFSGYLTDHIIPVYGLYPNTNTQITVTIDYYNGETDIITVPVQTEKLDSEIEKLHITASLDSPDEYSPGLNLCYRIGYTFRSTLAFDALGNLRLQLKLAPLGDIPADLQLMDYNEHFLQIITEKFETFTFVELDPLGRIYRAIEYDIGLPHHDILALGDNQILVLVNSTDAPTREDLIIALDLETGVITQVMDLKTILQTTRNLPPVYNSSETIDTEVVDSDYDPFHVNTVIATDNSDDIIISARNQNQILRLSWPEGEIKWIAGDPTGISPMYAKYYLTPIGDGFSYFYRQHAPEIMTDLDNDPETIDILLFDNGTTRNEFDRSLTADDLYSRMVHYRINEKEMTIELIREYGKEYGLGLFSTIHGDADELPNHNWLGAFDVSVHTRLINGVPTYVEINPDNELVWIMQIYKFQEGSDDIGLAEYRVERQSLYNGAANDLQLGNDPLVILKN